jgi:hypothetical protein
VWGWGSDEEEGARFEVDNGRGGWKKVNQTTTTPPDGEEEGWLRFRWTAEPGKQVEGRVSRVLGWLQSGEPEEARHAHHAAKNRRRQGGAVEQVTPREHGKVHAEERLGL